MDSAQDLVHVSRENSDTSATWRVMAVEELFEAILDHSTRETKARYARACKLWSNIALNSLWRSMDTMEPVFSLLSPLAEVRQSHGVSRTRIRELQFARKVRAKDWARFNTYASRIKYLRLRARAGEGDMPIVYSSSVLLEVAHKRRTLSLLPALVDLEVAASLDKSLLDYATLLIGENLQRLAIYMPPDFALMESLFEELAERVSELIEFRLWLPSDPEETDSLTTFLDAQTKLRVVGLSSNALQSDLITSLAELPLLEKLVTLSDDDGIEREVVSTLYLQLTKEDFPSLTTLQLVLPLDEASTFFIAGCSPPRLTNLSICTPRVETARALYSFFSHVSDVCPGLLELRVDDVFDIIDSPLLGDIFSSGEESGKEVDVVTIDTLRPLCDLSLLRKFTLSYHRMLHINNTDLDSLVSGWPHLIELTLSIQPTVTGDMPLLTLHALPLVARHCTQLRHLALYINCTGAIPSPGDLLPGEEPPGLTQRRFFNIKVLEFGLSPIGDAQTAAVAEYLCSIVPAFTLSIRLSWRFLANRAPLEGEHAALFRSQLWSEVRKLVPVMRNMMERAQARLEDARREIESLKARVKTLEEQIAKCA